MHEKRTLKTEENKKWSFLVGWATYYRPLDKKYTSHISNLDMHMLNKVSAIIFERMTVTRHLLPVLWPPKRENRQFRRF